METVKKIFSLSGRRKKEEASGGSFYDETDSAAHHFKKSSKVSYGPLKKSTKVKVASSKTNPDRFVKTRHASYIVETDHKGKAVEKSRAKLWNKHPPQLSKGVTEKENFGIESDHAEESVFMYQPYGNDIISEKEECAGSYSSKGMPSTQTPDHGFDTDGPDSKHYYDSGFVESPSKVSFESAPYIQPDTSKPNKRNWKSTSKYDKHKIDYQNKDFLGHADLKVGQSKEEHVGKDTGISEGEYIPEKEPNTNVNATEQKNGVEKNVLRPTFMKSGKTLKTESIRKSERTEITTAGEFVPENPENEIEGGSFIPETINEADEKHFVNETKLTPLSVKHSAVIKPHIHISESKKPISKKKVFFDNSMEETMPKTGEIMISSYDETDKGGVVSEHVGNTLSELFDDMQNQEVASEGGNFLFGKELKEVDYMADIEPETDFTELRLPKMDHLKWSKSIPLSNVKDMSIRDILQQAERRSLNLDTRRITDLHERFASLSPLEKRKYYTCGNQYLIQEQVPHWQETSQQIADGSIELKGPDKYQPDVDINQKVALWKGNIAVLEVDVIVNSSSSTLMDVREGVGKCICEDAGPLIDYEMNMLKSVYVGDIAVTAGYMLPAKYVYHTSGPASYWWDRSVQLKMCYINALNKMKEMGLRTLAFPCIATGAKSVRKHLAAETALKATRVWLQDNAHSVDKIIFCMYDDVNWLTYNEIMPQIYPPVIMETSSSGTSLPVEILRMDNKSIDLYKQVLTEGKEAVHNIRVMVVGHFGVGKTALTRRLLGKNVDIMTRESTNGIEVHVRKCKVSLQDGRWTVLHKDDKNENTFKRLAKLLTYQEITKDVNNKPPSGDEDMVDGFFEICDDLDSVTIPKTVDAEAGGFFEQNSELTDPDNDDTDVKIVDMVTMETESDFEYVSELDKEQNIMKDLKKLISEASNSNMQEEKNSADLSIWDFAGQYAFYSTHQVFLSPRAVYLLVTDISKHIDDVVMDDECYFDNSGPKSCKISEFFEFWLNSIHSYCPSIKTGVPPVILVGTHADKLNKAKKEQLSQAYFEAMRNFLLEKVTQFHLANEDFVVDNTMVDPTLDGLKKKILEVASQQDYWGELIPARWITLEKALSDLREEGLKIIKMADIEAVNLAMPVPLSTKEELQLFLRFQHDLGNILYFSDEGLHGHVLLDPQWLIDAFKCLITAKMFCCRTPHIYQKWQEFNKRAILKWDLIDAVWKKEEGRQYFNHRHHLIGLLEKLDIIAKPRAFNDDKSVTVQDYFFAPSILKDPPPSNYLIPCQSTDCMSTTILCFTVPSRFIPTALFNRFLAACLTRWPVSKQSKKDLIFCGCGVFDVNATHRLTVNFRDNVIQIWVTKYGRKVRLPSPLVCEYVREHVEKTLQRIIGQLFQGQQTEGQCCQSNKFEIYVKCPKNTDVNIGMLPLNDFLTNDEIPCHCLDNTHVLTASEMLRFWFKETSINTGPEGPSVLAFQTLEKAPSDKELGTICKRIGKEYQLLALELGLTQVDIDHVRMNNSHNVVDQIRNILMKWKENRETAATFRELETAMRNVHIDTVEVFKDIG